MKATKQSYIIIEATASEAFVIENALGRHVEDIREQAAAWREKGTIVGRSKSADAEADAAMVEGILKPLQDAMNE